MHELASGSGEDGSALPDYGKGDLEAARIQERSSVLGSEIRILRKGDTAMLSHWQQEYSGSSPREGGRLSCTVFKAGNKEHMTQHIHLRRRFASPLRR